MKDGPNFLRKRGPNRHFFSSTLTPGKKMKEVIVYGHVMDKNLLRFRQILLHLAVTAPAKSGL
jgi:hypothetical protein